MLFADHLVVVRGGGDLGTGAVLRLHRAGFPIVVLELEHPLTIRRTVAVSSAVHSGTFQVEELQAVRIDDTDEAVEVAATGRIPVLVGPHLHGLTPSVLIDARLAKRNIDTSIDDAALVIGLGPGFTAGQDCHAVVETARGHRLGRVIWTGSASPDTGVPGVVGGESEARVVRAPRSGRLQWSREIGDLVEQAQQIGSIDGTPIDARVKGVVRGLLAEGVVSPGLKIADIDPRGDRNACFEVSDKALAVGGGVLEAVLTWMSDAP